MLKSHEKFHSANGKRQILVVDDEPVNRQLLGLMLENSYEVIYAEDGQQGLAQMRENRETLSLVLLDLMMPVLSGTEMLRAIREEPALRKIPVIVLTADQNAEIESLGLGAIDFIPKPYPQAGVVLARIQRTIELSEDRQIIQSTERDPLTGLYNREYFYRYAEQYDQHHKDADMDALVVDVNHFHMLNERYGKAYADEVLRRSGERMREMVRDSGGIVCRREADTFMIYCPHRQDHQAILDSASADLMADSSVAGRVRLRMGIYANADKSIDIERRFDRAQIAADTVRNNYTQNLALYDAKLHERELYAEQLIDDFHAAIQQGQFQVYYQPKFDIRREAPLLTSAEALVRWRHPTLGMISPGAFIPLFEGNGMICRLDHYVWRETAAQIRDWKERFGFAVPVSVNVSRVDMFDADLAGVFTGLLAEFDLEPEELLLEITESAYTNDAELIIDTVRQLRELGFQVEMDDFGTGYSSLGMISHLPIDALKLDMAFVRNAFNEKKDIRMLELIIDIADYLQVPVVAEGVETPEQLQTLKNMGCDIVQGYYFSRPVPALEFERFLEEARQQYRQADADGLDKLHPTGPLDSRNEFVRRRDQREREYVAAMERSVTYSRIAQALAADYFSIYYVDVETDRFIEFSAHEEYDELGIEKGGEDFFDLSRKNILRVMYPEDQNRFLSVFTKENLLRELDENGTFTLTYRLMFGGVPTYVGMKAMRMEGGDRTHIVIGVNNIHNEMQRRLETVTYASIAEALAADYFSIYYVDTETDSFIEYSSHASYEDLNIEKGGDDFFNLSRKNILRVMHPEDQARFLQVFTKENLLRELEENGSFTLGYRLMFGEQPTFVSMKATRMTDRSDKHIVIGVNNVDAQMKRELAFTQELNSMRQAAERDPLTGVKSKHAFNKTEDEFNAHIAAGDQDAFAVAVCDVNGLKEVNDNQGHKAGDQYIRSASALICEVFKHSPVFRIGGDEFTAILRGQDYEHREALLESLTAASRVNQHTGGVVIASGLAVYRPGTDQNIGAVFERADAAMYENKKTLKGARL